jgi:hypothetical protein
MPGTYPDNAVLHPEYPVGTVFNTPPTCHALLLVNAHPEFHRYGADTHAISLPITGDPALGIIIRSTSGSIVLIAASSLDM